jgi:hypothetical protein
MDSNTSILLPSAIATLANENSLNDLKLLLKSLEIWNKSPPPVYLFCTTSMLPLLQKIYKGKLYTKTALDSYSGKTRPDMERLPSLKEMPNLFYDFTQEKCDLMEWALKETNNSERGVLFCDADILWLAPLPEPPIQKVLGLSQHFIRPVDEKKYGKYNAGFLWTNSLDVISAWREACNTSHFFEQAALEDVENLLDSSKVEKFGENMNYGWWRMFQSVNTPVEQQSKWSINRNKGGILVNGLPLLCIHTHFVTNDTVTSAFNKFVIDKLKILKSEKNIKTLLNYLHC